MAPGGLVGLAVSASIGGILLLGGSWEVEVYEQALQKQNDVKGTIT